ncbi:hypothetical protein [Peribacillus loiseleuriae]|uniref:hypothetical protein n=1 Tax=Peribacillus loiseleuriae TaxID=1679170 RepID=UPI003D025DD4
MYKATVSTCIVLLIIWGFILYKNNTTPEVVYGERTSSEIQAQTTKEISLVKEERLNKKELNEMHSRYSSPESAVEYLFAISILEEVNLFPDAFTVEQFNQDVSLIDEINKEKVVQELMKSLTQAGDLEKISIDNTMWTTDQKSVRLLVDLFYKKQKKPVRINIKVKKVDMLNNANGKVLSSYYYIDSSIKEIVARINKKI